MSAMSVQQISHQQYVHLPSTHLFQRANTPNSSLANRSIIVRFAYAAHIVHVMIMISAYNVSPMATPHIHINLQHIPFE